MIAITGSNGLVGSFITKRFVEAGLPVVAIVRKGSDLSLLKEVIDKITVREADVLDAPALADALEGTVTVIHAAAIVSFNPRRTKKIFEVNVEGTRNVVDTCLTLGIKRLIHISSVAALGRMKGNTTIDEESKWQRGPLNTDYSESKYRAELEIYRGMEEGLEVAMVNPSIILAAADWNKSSAQVFRYAWMQIPFYTAGSMNYVDVRDVAEMVLRIQAQDLKGQKFIANAGSVSYKEFFEQMAARFGKRPPRIKVAGIWLSLVARLEALRNLLAGTDPLITRQTARTANENFYYSQKKATDLLGIGFKSLEQTLDWCCTYYRQNVTINK